MGHQRRMSALASALGSLSLDSLLVPFSDPVTARVAVVDSYRVRADDPNWLKAEVVVAIDDLDRDLKVDLLVDPNPLMKGSSIHGANKVLLGPSFALVDPSVAEHHIRAISDDVHSIVVATGAGEGSGLGAMIAASLVAELPRQLIRLVIGPWGHQELPPGVEPISRVDGLIDDLAEADVVVSAGGVTMIESLCLARPTIALITAENQRRSVEGAVAHAAALFAAPSDVAKIVSSLIEDVGRRSALSTAARCYIDGKGAQRVAGEICGLI